MKSRVICSSCIFLASCNALTTKPESRTSINNISFSRRAFVASTILTTSIVNGAQPPNHANNCACSSCLSPPHSTNCACTSCSNTNNLFSNNNIFLPKPAYAYERDVGGADASAATAAFNVQARETNSRLETEGFKLDTKEEESKRLAAALSSSAYDSFSSGGGNSKRNTNSKAVRVGGSGTDSKINSK